MEDHLWYRLRRVLEGYPVELLKFADSHFGKAWLAEAWDEFTLWEDVPFDPESPHIPVFMPWFYFDWLPDPEETAVKAEAQDGLSLAQAYLNRKGKHLDPLLRRYLEACIEAPFSFYEVVSCEPGTGFALRDIFTGEQSQVTERSASRHAAPGDILFAKLAGVDHVTMLEACAPVMIPPQDKGPILELRKHIKKSKLPLTARLLKDYDLEMLDVYHEIVDRLLNPQMPELQNTDGDPLQFHKLIYDIDSPQEAFEALKGLCLTENEAVLRSEAEFDQVAKLRRIQFSWQKRGNKKHKEWDNTILGNITIDGGVLTAEVNSEKRAKKFQSLIEDLLPGKARYKTTVIQSMQAMLAKAKKEGESAEARRRREETEKLNALPEVQAKMAEMMRKHYESWIREKIPALGGKTPLQAVKNPEGREMVEALLLQMERGGRKMSPPLDQSIIRDLRERLGL